jgi:hypothetical protein
MKQLARALLVSLALVCGASLFGPALLGVSTASAAPARRSLPAQTTKAPTRVSLLTMGPGDHPFARFGHTALLLEWGDHTRVYNFGTFFFDGLQGVKDFMAGRFRYWLSVSDLQRTLAHYQAEERSLIAQDLDLTRKQALQLARLLEENARPENRFYDYDYYKDNCTTRVRDVLDEVLGGALRRSFQEPGSLTFREHTERLSAENLGLYVGLDIALGRFTDQVPTRFEELWVPDQLSAALDEVTLERGKRRVPLVRATRVLAETERPPSREAPPRWVPRFGLIGLALGACVAGLGHVAAGRVGSSPLGRRLLRARGAARALFGGFAALLGLVAGLLGSVVFVFWFTKHWAAHQNSNVLLFAPWALALTYSGVRLALGQAGSAATTRRIAFACVIAAVLGTLLPLLPGVGQDNLRLAALMVPLWGGLLLGASALAARAPLPASDERASLTATTAEPPPERSAPRDEPIAPETR